MALGQRSHARGRESATPSSGDRSARGLPDRRNRSSPCRASPRAARSLARVEMLGEQLLEFQQAAADAASWPASARPRRWSWRAVRSSTERVRLERRSDSSHHSRTACSTIRTDQPSATAVGRERLLPGAVWSAEERARVAGTQLPVGEQGPGPPAAARADGSSW